jgi:hypothetical protein
VKINYYIINYKYLQKEETKQNIVSNINFNFNTSHNVSSYYRKEKNISLETYNNILIDLKNLSLKINDDINSNNIYKFFS